MFRKASKGFLLVPLLWLSGCASLMNGVTTQLADNLSTAILNSNDVATVREAVPAYLLLIDSFIVNDPNQPELLMAAATLNGAYSVLVGESRTVILVDKAMDYASRGACLKVAQLCGLTRLPFAAFEQRIQAMTAEDITYLYGYAVAWTGWIQANSGDWNAIGQLARVKLMMARVLELDETWDRGGAHLYLGGLETILPASMGGRPDLGKIHFEKAIQLADGKFLMTKVVYAEQYAKLMFDKVLHDRLLNEVIQADPNFDGMTLTNRIAQERAVVLLADGEEYF
ncbi:MAG: hypothetical protein HOL98_00730 [Gammaproteobacteria bacterium]|jgi:hypothetical protein|nr:hypothetical protein [Gammaproteobacteria bacterium]MBT5201952.1 hypothetical protein [Gammaproteobacteria bacterium]MBT5603308.1 hypothetical protein [Gammaproteobacteria bacterium]MBT6244598.1 hypothetical protein [Gammaproteobacteria bacterium]